MSKFVGREPLLEVIHEHIERLRAGFGSIVLIRGSAGVGKWSAVSEALTGAADAGLDVLRWHTPPPDRADGALAVHETARRLLMDGGLTRPSVFAVEGLQRACPESLATITDLLQRLVQRPVLVLATMTGETGRPRSSAEAELERLARGHGVIRTLEEWTRPELRDYLMSHDMGAVDDRFMALVEAQAGGSPLLVHALVQLLAAARSSGDGRPPTASELRAAITAASEERWQFQQIQDHLFDGDADRCRVAQAVSAFHRFSLSDLGIVVDCLELPENRVAAAFDSLVGDGWLVAVESGVFAFRHEIVRTACCADLGPACRRRIHLAAITRLLATDDEESTWWLNEMATHIAALATRGNRSAVRVLAMAASSSVNDPATAAHWCELALDLLPPGSPEAAELRAIQARQLWAASCPLEAVDVGRQALAGMAPGDDRDAVVTLVADSLHAAGLLREAIDFLETQRSGEAAAVSRAAQSAHFLGLLGRVDEGDRAYSAAISGVDDLPGSQTATLVHLAQYANLRGRSPEVQELLERLRRTGETRQPRGTLIDECIAMLQAGPGFVAEAHASLDAVRAAHEPGVNQANGLYLVALVQNQWLRGDWGDALDTVAVALEAFEGGGLTANVAYVRSLAVSILVHRGDMGRARQHLEAIDWAPEAHRPVVLWASALVHRGLGERQRALEDLSAARSLGDHGLEFWRHLVLSEQAELEIDLGDPWATKTVAELVVMAQHRHEPWVTHLARRAEARLTADPCRATEALHVAQREGLQFDVARSRLLLSELGVEPEENLIEATRCFELLGADPWLRSTALVSRGLGLKVRRSPRARAGLLSEAEARIASLVRDGFSNRQIATGLHYSVKTVETYLTRIYTKTGCQSRLELARAMDTGRVPLMDLASA
jgi:DNA-binding CsgD family transcriptional regulator